MGTFKDQIATQAIGVGANAANSLLGAGMGLLLEKHNDKRQLEQQKKLQALQIAGDKQLTDYNFQKQLEMWEATNYKAQIEQMKKAGLNPGLMYGMGGGGGVTANITQGTVSGAEAPRGGQEIVNMTGMGLQAAQLGLLDAQRRNIEANTAKTQAETTNVPKTGENIEASTRAIGQGIENQKAQEALTRIQTRLTQTQADIANDTMDDAIQQIRYNVAKSEQEIKQLVIHNNISQATAEDQIKLVHEQAIGAALTNILTEAKTRETNKNIQVSEAQIKKMAADIRQKWVELGLEQVKVVQGQQQININQEQLAVNEAKALFEINYPGLWNVIGSNIDHAIQGLFKALKGEGRPDTRTIK